MTLAAKKLFEGRDLAALIVAARKVVPTDAQRRAASASFAYGTLALTKEYAEASPSRLAALWAQCRALAGCADAENAGGSP